MMALVMMNSLNLISGIEGIAKMAVDLATLYEIAEDRDQHADLTQRMASAISEHALDIIENAQETIPRKTWAYLALQNPENTAQTMLFPALIKANSANLLDNLPISVTDAQIRSTVGGLIDVYAEILSP